MTTSSSLQVAPGPSAVVESLPMLLRLCETVLLPLRAIIRHHGLTEQKARVLLILERGDVLEMAALAEACRLHLPSLSRIIAKLRAQGLIEQQSVRSDQRRMRVTVSPEGRRMALELRNALR